MEDNMQALGRDWTKFNPTSTVWQHSHSAMGKNLHGEGEARQLELKHEGFY
jgi:hypothetical protein